MPSHDEIAEDAAAYVVEELLEPSEDSSRIITAREFADSIGYEPGQISRAWKEAELEEYDVEVEKVGREENRINWRVSYDPDSSQIPEYTGPPVSREEGRWEKARQRLQGYGVTIERPEVLDAEYIDVYTEVLDRLEEKEVRDMDLIQDIASHDRIQERYDSVQARFRHAAERLSDLREGVAEIKERREQLKEATTILLRLD
ncbi:MAG: hypothetical protein ABEJ62_01655 [Candidatus Nanohaloarchaea archaeon]